MVTENEIKKYAAEHMHYTGKITPYIKSKILAEMNDSGDNNTSDDDIAFKKPLNVKKPKSKSTKNKVGRVLSTIGKGVRVTANYMSKYSERYHEYNISQKSVITKSKPKKKSVSKSKKKVVPKTAKRKTTAKTVKKTVRRSVKATRNAQRDFEDEIMGCM